MGDSGQSVFNEAPGRLAPLAAPGGKKQTKTRPAPAPQSKGRKTVPGHGGQFPALPPSAQGRD